MKKTRLGQPVTNNSKFQHQDRKSFNIPVTLSNVITKYKQASAEILIPEQPDQIPSAKINDATKPANLALSEISQHCSATSQVRLVISSSSKRWIIQTIDLDGADKIVGGDEFYITYHHNDTTAPKRSKEHPTAVAKIKDLGDGTYDLDFIASPMATVNMEEIPSKLLNLINGDKNEVTMGGNLTVHFVYTCGIGQITPPTKNVWKNGGYTQTSYTVTVNMAPPIRKFEHSSMPVNLDTFHHVIFVGDSLMEQFVRTGHSTIPSLIHFHSQTSFSRNIAKPLNSNTWNRFLARAQKDIAKQQKHKRINTNLALVLGSSVWDLLSDDAIYNTFEDHCSSMQKLIKNVQTQYPNITLLWKSPTAVHAHVVVNQNAVNRVRYMAESRSKLLYDYQKQICIEMNIPFLDIYDIYYLSADWHFPTDGRHYRPELNHYVFNWFYNKPENITINYK